MIDLKDITSFVVCGREIDRNGEGHEGRVLRGQPGSAGIVLKI
jgi:hypothetical protein